MTELLPEFSTLRVCGVFEGELVAFGDDGKPSFDRLCRRMLQQDPTVAVALALFDVLELDGEPTLRLSYVEWRELLEALSFGAGCHVSPRFDDGTALWRAIVDQQRRCRREEATRAVQARRTGMGEEEEPWLAALPGRT